LIIGDHWRKQCAETFAHDCLVFNSHALLRNAVYKIKYFSRPSPLCQNDSLSVCQNWPFLALHNWGKRDFTYFENNHFFYNLFEIVHASFSSVLLYKGLPPGGHFQPHLI